MDDMIVVQHGYIEVDRGEFDTQAGFEHSPGWTGMVREYMEDTQPLWAYEERDYEALFTDIFGDGVEVRVWNDEVMGVDTYQEGRTGYAISDSDGFTLWVVTGFGYHGYSPSGWDVIEMGHVDLGCDWPRVSVLASTGCGCRAWGGVEGFEDGMYSNMDLWERTDDNDDPVCEHGQAWEFSSYLN